jgi:hypothetical protein
MISASAINVRSFGSRASNAAGSLCAGMMMLTAGWSAKRCYPRFGCLKYARCPKFEQDIFRKF